MQSIPTLFVRTDRGRATKEINPDALWGVDPGDGYATEKRDGTACLVKEGVLYRRYRLKESDEAPTDWIHWNFNRPQPSGHGWLPVTAGRPEDRYHLEAWSVSDHGVQPDSTYELIGPKVQGNPYGLRVHILKGHFGSLNPQPPRDFYGIERYLTIHYIEGIVWHRHNGEMVKIKRRDFGIPWPQKHNCPTRPKEV